MKIVLVFAAFSAVGFLLCGAEYFVDPKGSDRNPGTAERPFRTAKQAGRVVKPGDVVTLRPGIHAGDITLANSGTKDKPIIFQGVRGANGEYLSIIDPGQIVQKITLQ